MGFKPFWIFQANQEEHCLNMSKPYPLDECTPTNMFPISYDRHLVGESWAMLGMFGSLQLLVGSDLKRGESESRETIQCDEAQILGEARYF